MTDYFTPRPALIIATNRSGGTFLMNCLDSHPQINCERTEPLNPDSIWMNLSDDREAVMKTIWAKPGYAVSMFKMTYRHARWVGWTFITEHNPVIIHLYRRNVLRVSVSSHINTLAAAGKINYPIHTFDEGHEPPRVKIDPNELIGEMRSYLDAVKAMQEQIKQLGLPTVFLTYTDLVGRDGKEAKKLPDDIRLSLCSTLRVDDYPMFSLTRRVNPFPLEQMVENWDQLRDMLEGTKYKEYLD